MCPGSPVALPSVTLVGGGAISFWLPPLPSSSLFLLGETLQTTKGWVWELGSATFLCRKNKGKLLSQWALRLKTSEPHTSWVPIPSLPTQRMRQQRATFLIVLINSDPNLSVWGSAGSPCAASTLLTDSLGLLLPPLYQGNPDWGRDPGSSNRCHWCKSLLYKLLELLACLMNTAESRKYSLYGSLPNRFGTSHSSAVYDKESLGT